MDHKIDVLQPALETVLAGRFKSLVRDRGELTLTVAAAEYLSVCESLRDDEALQFEQMVDLCGMDYSAYRDAGESPFSDGPRYAVVLHLLSVRKNWRLRVRVFCPDDDVPCIASINEIWGSANWFEREAFDLFGIVFEGHADLRRILTDYGFIGHPFRKDFPVTGHVEMRYDPEQRRVIYQPVTIEPREIVPRIIREQDYGAAR